MKKVSDTSCSMVVELAREEKSTKQKKYILIYERCQHIFYIFPIILLQ